MKTVLLSCCIALVFASCAKKEEGMPVQIRVKNETTAAIDDVKVYSFGNNATPDLQQLYGTITSNSSSSYVSFQQVVDIPLLSYSIAGTQMIDISRVRCASPMPEILPAGKYTLRISGDCSSPEVNFVKD